MGNTLTFCIDGPYGYPVACLPYGACVGLLWEDAQQCRRPVAQVTYGCNRGEPISGAGAGAVVARLDELHALLQAGPTTP